MLATTDGASSEEKVPNLGLDSEEDKVSIIGMKGQSRWILAGKQPIVAIGCQLIDISPGNSATMKLVLACLVYVAASWRRGKHGELAASRCLQPGAVVAATCAAGKG